mmetsp:Transcript_3972/g.8159  ORF Transcript_3972/g.8159 Transcript_3972/m.8159 type:complete len:88 (-) Transcript_3972:19-282(-)
MPGCSEETDGLTAHALAPFLLTRSSTEARKVLLPSIRVNLAPFRARLDFVVDPCFLRCPVLSPSLYICAFFLFFFSTTERSIDRFFD